MTVYFLSTLFLFTVALVACSRYHIPPQGQVQVQTPANVSPPAPQVSQSPTSMIHAIDASGATFA